MNFVYNCPYSEATGGSYIYLRSGSPYDFICCGSCTDLLSTDNKSFHRSRSAYLLSELYTKAGNT